MAAHAQAPKGGALTASSSDPKDEFDTIAGAVPIGEEPSIKKERKAKSAARYLLSNVFTAAQPPTSNHPQPFASAKPQRIDLVKTRPGWDH